MNRTPVVSTNLESVGYENGTLEVAFLNGGVYQYSNVPEHTYRDLMSADSKGKYFLRHIRDRFQTIKVR